MKKDYFNSKMLLYFFGKNFIFKLYSPLKLTTNLIGMNANDKSNNKIKSNVVHAVIPATP